MTFIYFYASLKDKVLLRLACFLSFPYLSLYFYPTFTSDG